MRRVPLGAKPQSLLDIKAEDEAREAAISKEALDNVNPISDIINMKASEVPQRGDITEKGDVVERVKENPISEIVNTKSVVPEKSVKNDKSDYEKVTVTLAPKLFWALEDEKRTRRMAKVDYSFSEIVRDALTEYFIKQGREV